MAASKLILRTHLMLLSTHIKETSEQLKNNAPLQVPYDYLQKLVKDTRTALEKLQIDSEDEKKTECEELLVSAIQTIQEGEKRISELKSKLESQTKSEPKDPTPPIFPTVKLPPIELKPFDGDITQFTAFWEIFTVTIAKQKLSNAEKLSYLKSYLRKDAAQLLEGLSTTDENYDIAVDLLKSQYNDKQQIVDQLYEKLKAIPKASNKTESLRSTYNKIEATLRNLETQNEETNNNLTLNIIRKKFPEEVVTKVAELCDDDDLTSDLFRTTMLKIIRRKEKFSASSLEDSTEKKEPYTAEALLTREVRSPKKKCVYCEQDHWSDECTTFKTIEERKEKLKGSCFICLGSGHGFRECKKDRICVHCTRKNNHHRSLCPQKFGDQTTKPFAVATSSNTKPESPALLTGTEKGTLLTATTQIRNGEHSKTIRIIFDTGSVRTYITKNLINSLKLETLYEESLNIKTLNAKKPGLVNTAVVSLSLMLDNGDKVNITANSIPKIINQFERSTPKYVETLAHEHNLKLADNNGNYDVDMLIGIDHYFALVMDERIPVDKNLFLVKSHLGWLLGGAAPKATTSLITEIAEETTCLLTKDITTLWELDAIGIKHIEDDKEEEAALNEFYDNVSFENNRYTVAWPWKEYPPNLPSNYGLAKGRLMSQYNKLKTEENEYLRQAYDNTIQQQLDKGVIEEVFTINSDNPCHYLPHHIVETPGKSTEYRIVYDGSAKTNKKNKSLNDCLFKGKNLIENNCVLIILFRLYEHGIVADIEKAFLQLLLHLRDRDTVRFLWLKNPTLPPTEDNIRIFRFCSIPFGVISCPFLLKATILYHLTKIRSQTTDKKLCQVIDKLIGEFYFDNLISGVPDTQQGKEFYDEVKAVFQSASMNIRNWVSSNQELNSYFSNDKLAANQISVLGILWSTETDTLNVKQNLPEDNIPSSVTKRNVLKSVASVYDPVGFFAPIILQGKILLKKLWVKNIRWDEQLDEEQLIEWKQILSQLSYIPSHKIPRWIQTKPGDEVDLHIFVDASKDAYGVAVYLQLMNQSTLIFAKARVSPIKSLTIPRLELLAVLLGVRVKKFIQKAISSYVICKQIYLWTDSKCVLAWIKTDKILPSFVEHRLSEIKTHNDVQFRYVPTNDNIADLASRGCDFDRLVTDDNVWWNGPNFLHLPEDNWPKNEYDETIMLTTTIHENKKAVPVKNSLFESCVGIDIRDYDSYERLITDTVHRLRAGCTDERSTVNTPICIEERNSAQLIWLRETQQLYFPNIIEKQADKCSIIQRKQLGLWQDKFGVIRCSGRLICSELEYDEKFPILLSHKSYFTTLLVLRYHLTLNHAGVAQTLAEMRTTYWILRGRATVGKILRNHCLNCNHLKNLPFKSPPIAPLPSERTTTNPPFTHVGADIFGPLYTTIQVEDKIVQKKVWCLLFTCFVTRAIHIEMLHDLTTEEIILSTRCFVARRGIPALILTDNAPQFHLVSKLVSDQLFVTQGIEWKFTPPSAPWMGGIYERMVGVVKMALKKTLFKTCISQRQLQALLYEIEATVNTRPLLYVDGEFPSNILTPTRLISFRRNCDTLNLNVTSTYDDAVKSFTNTGQNIIALWKKTTNLLSHFWSLWKRSYLQTLRERYENKSKRGSRTLPSVGHVVLVEEDGSRLKWPVAKIRKLIESSDGEIRSAEIETDTGFITTRPVNKLYPLGLELVPEENEKSSDSEPSPILQTTQQTNPPPPTSLNSAEDFDDIDEITCEVVSDDSD